MYLQIEMLWMSKTGLEIIPDDEQNKVGLSSEDWQEIRTLCEAEANRKFNSVSVRWEIIYLYAVALLHCEEWKAADDIFRTLRQRPVKDKPKQYYVICDNSGNPKVFSRGKLESDKNKWFLEVENGGRILFNTRYARDFGCTESEIRSGRLLNKDFFVTVSLFGLEARVSRGEIHLL